MEIIVSYSEDQLKAAVSFIAKHNPTFYGNHKEIRDSILENIERLATSSSIDSISTMGYLLTCDCEYEGIDNDDNTCRIEIHVDPSLGVDYEKEKYIEKVVSTP